MTTDALVSELCLKSTYDLINFPSRNLKGLLYYVNIENIARKKIRDILPDLPFLFNNTPIFQELSFPEPF